MVKRAYVLTVIEIFLLSVASPAGSAAVAAGQSEPASDQKQATPPANVGGLEGAAHAGTIRGVVRFKGQKPEPRPIAEIAGNAFCKHCYEDKLPAREDIVLGKDGALCNVLVYVSKGLEGKKFDPPKRPAVLDQVGCMYVPHVVAVMAGQTLEVRNSDETLHNVMASPRQNPPFNFGMPAGRDPVRKVFSQPELNIALHCFMHPWMSGYLHVMENPYFAVTADDGSFTIKGLPPGEYEITALHEGSLLEAERPTMTAKIGHDETRQIDFTFHPTVTKK